MILRGFASRNQKNMLKLLKINFCMEEFNRNPRNIKQFPTTSLPIGTLAKQSPIGTLAKQSTSTGTQGLWLVLLEIEGSVARLSPFSAPA